jgi:hypothetical protein
MAERPTAAIAICTDRRLAVGTAVATMLLLLAAHDRSGAGPVSSFSRAVVVVVVVVRPPMGWVDELILCLGHPALVQPPAMVPRPRLWWQDLARWVPE